MGLSRDLLRAEAKKLYKEQIKGVPKRSRLPFAEFYKQFKRMKSGKTIEEEHDHDHDTEVMEDFDVSQVANINKVTDPVTPKVDGPIHGPGKTVSSPATIRRTGHK